MLIMCFIYDVFVVGLLHRLDLVGVFVYVIVLCFAVFTTG